MLKWIFNNSFLENHELLFYISAALTLIFIIITIYLVRKELKK